MYSAKENKLKPCTWSRVESALAPALGDYLSAAKEQVNKGNEFTFMCEGAALLLRAENTELVIVGFSGVHCIKAAAPHIIAVAQQVGAKTLRCHTQRAGECRYLNALGYPFTQQRINDEYVLRMVINGR